MSDLGDFPEDFTALNFKFNTRRFSSGAPFALVGGVVSVYKNNDATQSTAGITLTTPFDSVVGMGHILIDLSSDAFYATGGEYDIVLTAGTVDSVSVIGAVLKHFSIERTGGILALLKDSGFGLAQLVRSTTPANTLDVEASGTAGVDWGNVANKTTANNLSGTDIQLVGTTSVNSDMRGTDGVDTATMRGTDGVDTATMRGTDNALLASSAPTNFGDLAITASTGRIDVGLWLGTPVTLSSGAPDVNIQSTDNVALSDQQKLDVNFQVEDVIFVQTRSQPGQGALAATQTLGLMVSFQYKFLRNENKLNKTTGLFEILNDDAVTVDHKATVSDDGTIAIKGEIVAGP